jgi:DNA-binding transcriptional MerR regulator
MGELPPKLFFRIGEVAGLVGVEPHVLRYWEREFRSIRPTKSAKGQRVYSRKDVENLLRVRDLLYRDGFTIAGAKKKLQRGDEEPATSGTDVLGSSPLRSEAGLEGIDAAGELDADADDADVTDGRRSPAHAVDAQLVLAAVSDAPRVREKLVALRREIEAFLVELSSNPRR